MILDIFSISRQRLLVTTSSQYGLYWLELNIFQVHNYGACSGLDSLDLTILSMSRDQNIFYVVVRKNYSKNLMDQSSLV